MTAGPADVRFDGTEMDSAETSGIAQTDATLAKRKESNVSEIGPQRLSGTTRTPLKLEGPYSPEKS